MSAPHSYTLDLVKRLRAASDIVRGTYSGCASLLLEEAADSLEKQCGPTPLTRSAAAFPADYRRVLEASNLPVEVATAIADRLEQCRGPDDRKNVLVPRSLLHRIQVLCGDLGVQVSLHNLLSQTADDESQSSATPESR